MGELGRYGPRLPHDEAAQREHFKEVDEDLSRDQEADRIAKRRSTRPRWGIGYLVVLLGVAGFVLSCFLPYTQFFDQVSISYYRLATASRGGTLEYVGGLLLMFGGTATVAWVALAGLRHGQHERRQTPSILLRLGGLVLVVDRRCRQCLGTLWTRSGLLVHARQRRCCHRWHGRRLDLGTTHEA
jgi:hypothetical protein